MIRKVFEIGLPGKPGKMDDDDFDITLWVGTKKNSLSIRKVKQLEDQGWYVKEIEGQINKADLDFIIE